MSDESKWTTELDLSFDPRSWDVGPAAEPAPSITDGGHVSRFALALAGSLLILAIGVAAAWASRP